MTVSDTKSLFSLAASYIKIKASLLKQLKTGNSQLTAGTVDWLPIKQLLDEEPDGSAFIPVLAGRLFLSRS